MHTLHGIGYKSRKGTEMEGSLHERIYPNLKIFLVGIWDDIDFEGFIVKCGIANIPHLLKTEELLAELKPDCLPFPDDDPRGIFKAIKAHRHWCSVKHILELYGDDLELE